jgi:uncharacterized protein with GYD domain
MATFMTLLRYTSEGAEGISGDRTRRVEQVLAEMNGKLLGGYGLLGQWDAVIFFDVPDLNMALKASSRIGRLTGSRTETMGAIPLSDFDQLF